MGLLIAGVFYARSVDWDQYRSAVPPDSIDQIDCLTAKISVLELNSEKPLDSELSLRAGQIAPILLMAETDTAQWRWNVFGMSNADNVARQKQAHLPRLVFRLEFVRRSSLGSRELSVVRSMSNPKRIDSKRVRWDCECRVPDALGVYRVRLLVGKSNGGVRNMTVTYETLASFDVHVHAD